MFGTQEAVYHGVPMIVFPVWLDQNRNAALSVKRGFSIQLEITATTADQIVEAINKVTNTSRYLFQLI